MLSVSRRALLALPLWCSALFVVPALPAFAGDAPRHALTLHGSPKYGPDFKHFAYVNPDAPKGGELKLAAMGSYDTFNSFTIKGTPPAGIGMVYETLLTPAADEAFTEYGLLAESVTLAPDNTAVTFTLRPQAKFSDGKPVTPEDVIWSFNTLKEKGRPFYAFYYGDVKEVSKSGPRQVTFTFKDGSNRELPLTLGEMPILPKHFWDGKDFSASTLEPPVGSGPYRLKSFEAGRYVVYERVADWWAKDLPVTRGLYNFDTIRYDYYRDTTVALEAFKAGAYDVRPENVAKLWATGYDFPAVKDGKVLKLDVPHKMPSGMQGFAYNLRRPLFQDDRVRQALALAFDFEWSNQNLFYGQYLRTVSYFDNSELAATGLPGKDELALLEPLRKDLPPDVFTTVYQPPSTAGDNGLRVNLRQAMELLKAAGWSVKDGVLTNAQGQPFRFEILLSDPTWERIALPFAQNLKRLGIEASVRTVDSAQYQSRMDTFDYDMTVEIWGQSLSPGNEQRDFWGCAAAKQDGSRNTTGICSPAIDALIEKVVQAKDRNELITATRALDRVLLWSHQVIPHWHISSSRVALWNRFGMPAVSPMQGMQLMAWWADPKGLPVGFQPKAE
ncbi:extracellular solute-binding protein [Insolitispirillum peregrinum]|uniref:Microcin C transport system substrate-binding protein n=1 Tax=Insolitispirillum peregrinum TaxID=80876 RepID=A0A1N7KEY6_9PROT|nr:extracellular solute-binding protein [Insolitispirillum peregrinum]SIS60060.1 microcin C transport system substrate-binding protein [Insolitispirillum peregrinum]